MVDSLAAAKSGEDALLFRATLFWDNQEDVLADGLGRRVPKELLGASIPRGDDAIQGLADNGIVGGFNNRRQERPQLVASFFGIGQMRVSALHLTHFSGLIIAHRIPIVLPHHSRSGGSPPQHRAEREPSVSRVEHPPPTATRSMTARSFLSRYAARMQRRPRGNVEPKRARRPGTAEGPR